MRPICRECANKKNRLYYIDNKEYIDNKHRKYAQGNKEKIKQYYVDWCAKNREKIKEYDKRHYRKNRNKIIEQKGQRIIEQRKNDVVLRIKSNLRCRINMAIKNNQKIGSAVSDLGCSIKKLKNIFEKQFYNNPETSEKMTWDNYGKWHIDHIFPLSYFDLADREQFLKACHYTNLQPLWAIDNLKKGAKIDV